MKDLKAFTEECIFELHKEAMKYGVANNGPIDIDALYYPGFRAIHTVFENPYYKKIYKPAEYLCFLVIVAIDFGVLFANQWYADYFLLDDYVDRIIEEGPLDEANELIKELFGESFCAGYGDFFVSIIVKWAGLLRPYKALENLDDYTIRSLMASYILGISMVLEKYGYGEQKEPDKNENITEDNRMNNNYSNRVINEQQLSNETVKQPIINVNEYAIFSEMIHRAYAQIPKNENEIKQVYYCRKCGYKLEDDAKYCTECGTKVR